MPAVMKSQALAKPKPADKKPAKEKKPMGAKSSSLSHPPYFEMIKDAILALRERTGSSAYAIGKHVEEKQKGALPANFKKMLAVQLRKLAANGKLAKVKASFKLSEPGKKEIKPAVKKPKAAALLKRKAPVAVPKKKMKPLAAVKTPVAKKAGTKKMKKVASVKPKQPKSMKKAAAVKPRQPETIKPPVTKKARKVAA